MTDGQNEFNKIDNNIKVKTKEFEDKNMIIKRLENDIVEQNKIKYEIEKNLMNERESFDRIFNSTNNEINLNQLENKDLEHKYLGINNSFNSSMKDKDNIRRNFESFKNETQLEIYNKDNKIKNLNSELLICENRLRDIIN